MAVIAYLDSLDLVIESHGLTPEDVKAFQQAIAESRSRRDPAENAAEIMRIMAEGRAIQEQRARTQDAGLEEKTSENEVASHTDPRA